MTVLEEHLAKLSNPESRFDKVVIFSGHMIDSPGRKEPRFPPEKERAVRDRIAKQLDEWDVGPRDLAISGCARGGDILFAELAADRGARVWLFIALPEEEFLDKSVRLPASDWEERYFKLKNREGVETFFLHEERGDPPEGMSVFESANLWIIETAGALTSADNLYAVLVWDEKPTGDGPGGTSDFASRVKRMGGQVAVINPIFVKEGD